MKASEEITEPLAAFGEFCKGNLFEGSPGAVDHSQTSVPDLFRIRWRNRPGSSGATSNIRYDKYIVFVRQDDAFEASAKLELFDDMQPTESPPTTSLRVALGEIPHSQSHAGFFLLLGFVFEILGKVLCSLGLLVAMGTASGSTHFFS